MWLVRILNCNEASLFAWTISQEVKDIVLGVDTKNLEQKNEKLLNTRLDLYSHCTFYLDLQQGTIFILNFNSFQMNITCSNYLDSKECTAIISHVTRHPLSWPDSSRILILKSEKKNELWKKSNSLLLVEWLLLPTNGHKHILKRKKASLPSGHNLMGNN